MVRRIVETLGLFLITCLAMSPGAYAQQPAAKVVAAPALAPVNLGTLPAETQTWLADLIRIDTTNPPGNELAAANYVAGVLRRESISAEVLELAPGRGAVVARLQAGPLPDPSRALLLVGHLDVVGVDPSKWTVSAFSGTVKDGYIYGRGAIDDKGMIAANLAAFIALKRAGVRLTRDVIFLADADEEEAGAANIRAIIDKYWDKIACAFALNEGGRVLMTADGKTQYVGVQASEKVAYNVTLTATGVAGHASVPRPDNAVVHLAAAIEKISAYRPPAQPTTITRRYFERLTSIEDEDTARSMRALETPQRLELAAGRLSDVSPVWSSMLRDSVTPTELRAGIRASVVPSEANATLNVRLLPSNTIEPLIAQLQKVVNDPQIRFTVAPGRGISAPSSSTESELFQTIERIVPQQFPGAIVVPFLSTSATDSAELRLRNVQALGLMPFPLTEADEQRVHGDDERLSLASFHTGVDFLYRIVHEFTAAK
jgi:acetylornithine deacetylase/succinyl-diaminopimelate desuccinylase-like protein